MSDFQKLIASIGVQRVIRPQGRSKQSNNTNGEPIKAPSSLASQPLRKIPVKSVYNGPVFSSRTHRGFKIPSSIKSITFDEVYHILQSISLDTSSTDPLSLEMRRSARFLKVSWSAEELDTKVDTMIKDFVVDLYQRNAPSLRLVQHCSTPDHHYYDKTNRDIVIRDFDDSYFVSTNNKAPLLSVSNDSEGNFIYDLISKANVVRKQLTMQTLKSILRTYQSKGLTVENAIVLLRRKCPLWKPGKDYSETVSRSFSWFVPFIPDHMMFLQTSDANKFQRLFADMINILYGSVIDFARTYFAIGSLSATSRKQLFVDRKRLFIKKLRSPEIQALYLTGTTHKEVGDIVYQRYNKDFIKSALDSPIHTSHKKLAAKARDRDRKVQRDKRTQSTFEPQSLTTMTAGPILMYSSLALLFTLVATIVRYVYMKLTVYYRTIEIARDDYENVHNYIETIRSSLLNPNSAIAPEYKLLAVEVKSIMHILFHLMKGNKYGAIEWLSNFAITRPELIRDFVCSLDPTHLLNFVKPQPVRVSYEGTNYTTTSDGYRQYCDAYDRGADRQEILGVLETHSTDFSPQSGVVEEVFATCGKIFGGLSVLGMSKEDIQMANAQFTFVNHNAKMFSSHMGIISKVVSVLCRTLFAYDPFDVDYQIFVDEVLDIIIYTEKLLLITELVSNKPKMVEVLEIHDKANALAINPRMLSLPAFLTTKFRTRCSQLEERAIMSRGALIGTGSRKEPIFTLFTGPPKCGKSSAINYLQRAICQLRGEKYTADMTYTYNSKDKFWDAYRHNLFMIMDDLFKEDVRETLVEESSAIINLVNSVACPLNVAFGDKGFVNFDSEYIFGSTNYCNNGINKTKFVVGLRDSTALLRRFHLVLHRSDVTNENILHNQFRVDKCDFPPFKRYEGKTLRLPQIAKLIHAIEKYVTKTTAGYEMTADELEASLLMPLDDEPFEPPETPLFKDVYLPPREEQTDLLEVEAECRLRGLEPTGNYIQDLSQVNNYDRETYELDEAYELSRDRRRVGFKAQSDPSEKPYPNAAPPPRQPIDPTRFIVKGIEAGLFIWWENDLKHMFIWIFWFFVTLATARHLIKSFFPEDTFETNTFEQDRFTGNFSRAQKAAKSIRQPKKELRKITSKSLQWRGFSQQSLSENYMNCLHTRMSRCVCAITGEAHNEGESNNHGETAMGFHLSSGWVLVPAHFVLPLNRYDQATYGIKFDGDAYEIDISEPMQVGDDDMVIFKLPIKDKRGKTIPMPISGINYLSKFDDLFDIEDGYPLNLVGRQVSGQFFTRDFNKSPNTKPLQYKVDTTPFFIEKPIAYCHKTYEGDSGAPVCVQTNDGSVRIVGIHLGVSKSSSMELGMALPLFREMFEDLPIDISVQSLPTDFPMRVDRIAPRAYLSPKRTKFTQTKMHGYLGEPFKIPTHLRPFKNPDGEEINPIFLQLQKLNQDPTPNIYVKECVYSYLKKKYPRWSTSSVLDVDEALNGCKEKEARSVTLQTSPGFPYCLDATAGKCPFLYRDTDQRIYMSETFSNTFSGILEKVRNHDPIEVLWADTPKDELRLPDKVHAGKTRVFATCPLHFLILYRMYFGDFNNYVQNLAASHPISVGINPHSNQWSFIYERMTKFENGSVVAMDYKGFDASIRKDVLLAALKFINWWYNDGAENARIREELFEHIVHSHHIYEAFIYICNGGNPSGNPGTSIINSICNLIILVTVLIEILGLCEDQFEIVVYGDDNLVHTPIPDLTGRAFSKPIAEIFGMEVTHCSKIADYFPVDTISTVSYLGRSFVKQGAIIKAPLLLDIIMYSTYYMKGKSNSEAIMISMLRSVFIELSHYTRSEFETHTQTVFSAVLQRMPSLYNTVTNICESYDYYHNGMYVKDKFKNFKTFTC